MAVVLICILGGMLAAEMPLTDDVSWYIVAVRQWADGQALFSEIGDINTPGIYYLHRCAHVLAEALGVSDHLALIALLSSCVLVIALWSNALLERDAGMPAFVRCGFVLSFSATAYLIALLDFGQREHWAFVFFLPQILAVYLSALGRSANPLSRHCAACLAGLTLTLKPHFLLVYLLLEAGLAAKRGSLFSLLRSENLIAGALTAVGFLVFFLLYPSYFTEILPRAAHLYGAFSFGWFAGYGSKVILLSSLLTCLGLVLTSSGLLKRENLRTLAFFLFLSAAAFLLLFLLQQKGWSYQYLPALGYAVLAAGLLLLFSLRRFGARLVARQWAPSLSLREGVFLGGVLLFASLPAAVIYKAANQVAQGASYSLPIRLLSQELVVRGPQAKVFSLSTAISPSFPAIALTDAVWVGLQPSLWEFPAYYELYRSREVPIPYRPPSRQDRYERQSFEMILAVLREKQPDIVVVYVSAPRPPYGRYFDFIAYLNQDPRFLRLWDHYALSRRLVNHEIYRRKTSN